MSNSISNTVESPVGAVLVAGGGIAGIQAALDLGDSGFFVYLVEQSPAIGGVMAKARETYVLSGPAPTYQGHTFRRLEAGEVPDLSCRHTLVSPKSVVFPPSDPVLKFSGDDWTTPDLTALPLQAAVGIRPYDAKALHLLKYNFDTPEHKDPFFLSRFENLTLVGLAENHPDPANFSTSCGTGPFDESFLDILLVDLGDALAGRILTDKGEAFARAAGLAPIAAEKKAAVVSTIAALKTRAEESVTKIDAFRGGGGDVIGIRGPMGNGFPLEQMIGKNILIIGGGFAFTTLRSMILTLMQPADRDRYGTIDVVYGARNPGMLLYREELDMWNRQPEINMHITVDGTDEPDWPHHTGFVPAVTGECAPENTGDAIAVVCGPPVMIKFTRPVLTDMGYQDKDILMSLENRMKCGIGMCGRCNIGKELVCKDGPVFNLAYLNETPGEF